MISTLQSLHQELEEAAIGTLPRKSVNAPLILSSSRDPGPSSLWCRAFTCGCLHGSKRASFRAFPKVPSSVRESGLRGCCGGSGGVGPPVQYLVQKMFITTPRSSAPAYGIVETLQHLAINPASVVALPDYFDLLVQRLDFLTNRRYRYRKLVSRRYREAVRSSRISPLQVLRRTPFRSVQETNTSTTLSALLSPPF
ncbi:hypothetical protein FKP32DRAFT_392807 [Trametes sanguinea]|nr:hypothetical protein FKP32DRAFT_392807 [Trametes sanguinea]